MFVSKKSGIAFNTDIIYYIYFIKENEKLKFFSDKESDSIKCTKKSWKHFSVELMRSSFGSDFLVAGNAVISIQKISHFHLDGLNLHYKLINGMSITSTWKSSSSVDLIFDQITAWNNSHKKNHEKHLQEIIEILKYAPDGPGYDEAKTSFEKLQK
jgi:hypothetical protein